VAMLGDYVLIAYATYDFEFHSLRMDANVIGMAGGIVLNIII
jgi:hypothetical protein